MDAELSEIRPLRKRLGLTQHQLAKAAGVSQSLIAKVESGLVDPSFTAGKGILATLRAFERQREPSAHELMQSRLVTAKPGEKVRAAIRKMQERAISQLPVVEENDVVGLLTEKAIITHMDGMGETTLVRDVMEEAPPIVPPSAPRRVLVELLSHYTLVLVKEKGKVKGILTKADLLKSV